MRTLDTVIDQMLEVIPAKEKGLIEELLKIKESDSWAAPELKGLWWGEAQGVLANHIKMNGTHSDWQREVILIWTGKK